MLFSTSCKVHLAAPVKSCSYSIIPSSVERSRANSHLSLAVLLNFIYISEQPLAKLASFSINHSSISWLTSTLQVFQQSVQLSSVQSLSHVRLFVTTWTAAHQASLSITNSWSWLKLMSIESVMASNHIILCCPLLLLPSIFPSIRVFSNETVLHIKWPMYWSFSFSISASSEYSELISFRMDGLDLFAVWGSLRRLLQHHSLKLSILWCSAFFIVQLSHPYMTTGKTIASTRQTFVGKVMSLLY